ncbi:MAG TPA: hypothetical protein ENH26_01515 [Candidatus Wolfebacteria bacterium]|nr:hypothetical protein [Candidatus Wolfebacteria bacterium]
MKLNFKIDKNYLIINTLSCTGDYGFSSKKYQKDIIAFQNYAWNKSKKYYDFLAGRTVFSPELLAAKNLKSFTSKLHYELPNFLSTLKRSKEFKKIYLQTKKYSKFCDAQWKKNYTKTSKIIKELTGFNLNQTFNIYITHPSQKHGKNLGNNEIGWGHSENWPNYITVYLWHEILHSYFTISNLSHAIIELITDEELRKKLNKIKYPPFVGHQYLTEIKKKILPLWKKYLKSSNKDIDKFQKQTKSLLKSHNQSPTPTT